MAKRNYEFEEWLSLAMPEMTPDEIEEEERWLEQRAKESKNDDAREQVSSDSGAQHPVVS